MCCTFLLVIVAAPGLVWAALRSGGRARGWGLQAATSLGRPVVLRVEAHGGHGLGPARDQESALCGSSVMGGR